MGKTSVLLQWARRLAEDGHTAVVVCYDHDLHGLMERLLVQAAAEAATPADNGALASLRSTARQLASGQAASITPAARLLRAAAQQLTALGDRLRLVQGSSAHTDPAALAQLVESASSPVLLVDHLQKVASPQEAAGDEPGLRRIATGLKELALAHRACVLATATCERAALTGRRALMRHLTGAAVLSYEADLIMMLNPKIDAVAESHVPRDSGRADAMRRMAVISVEKNRGGPAPIDMEFRCELDHFRVDPAGGFVTEVMSS